MCAIKRRLPSHPRLMVILLGEIEGFSFPGKKSLDGLLLPPSSFLSYPPSRMRHLAGVFFRPSNVPQKTTTFTRASRFSDGFFDKAPETTGSSVVGSTTITIDWRTLASIAYVRRKGWRRCLRGKIAFPGLYRHAGGRTMSEARSISTATMVLGDIRTTRWTWEGREGLGGKKGRMSGRSGENRRERM